MNKKIEEAMHKYLAKSNPPKTVYVHTNDLLFNAKILYDLGYITKEIYDKLYKYCLYHDIGKCNDIMNNRLNAAIKGTRINFDENLEVPHNILSFEMLDENDFEDKEEYYRTSYIVLNHHAHIDNNEYITNPLNDELLKKTLEQYNLAPRSKKQIRQYHRYIEDNLTKDIIFEKGLLHKCDYSASGETTIEYKNDFLENSMDNMYARNSFIPNELQTFTRNNRNKNLCIVAQTGMGKTEASLLWGGNNKIVYFLPLRASINAIFDRIKTQVLDNDIKEKLGLLHSNALEKLGKNEYINDEYDFLRHYNESKNLCLPLSISTIDQLFTFVYKYPTYEINVANLAMSKIIIDEIQGFDAKLFADLVYGLEFLSYYGTKLLITTATLPPYLRDLLFKNISFNYQTFINNDIKRHNLKVLDDKLSAKDVYEHYIKYKKKHLVICNTIKKAKEIAFELKNKYGLENVRLLHSEFSKKDRQTKESDIFNCGKTNNEEDCIWVTTQIVEASLDIDFDYLFTEMSDLSGLFQRLGRINRKGKKPFNEYNCFVYLKTNKYLLNRVIDEAIYKLSCEAIKTIDGYLSETKKLELIEEYLTTKNLKDFNSEFLTKFNEEYQYLQNLEAGTMDKQPLRNIENIEFIPYSLYEENKDFIEENLQILQHSKHNTEEYIKAKSNVLDFVVSVDKGKARKNNYIGHLLMNIEISKYEKIPIYSCEYNSEVGIVNTKNSNSSFI